MARTGQDLEILSRAGSDEVIVAMSQLTKDERERFPKSGRDNLKHLTAKHDPLPTVESLHPFSSTICYKCATLLPLLPTINSTLDISRRHSLIKAQSAHRILRATNMILFHKQVTGESHGIKSDLAERAYARLL